MNDTLEPLAICRRRLDVHGEQSVFISCVQLGVGPDWGPSLFGDGSWFPTSALPTLLESNHRLYVIGPDAARRMSLLGCINEKTPPQEVRSLIASVPSDTDEATGT